MHQTYTSASENKPTCHFTSFLFIALEFNDVIRILPIQGFVPQSIAASSPPYEGLTRNLISRPFLVDPLWFPFSTGLTTE